MNRKLIEKTPFGPVAILWAELEGLPKVFRVLLSKAGLSAETGVGGLYPGSHPASCAAIDAVARGIRDFLAGEDVVLSLDSAAMATRPAFQQSVLRAEHAIPRGRVSTYGLIAACLGNPKAVRAVGNALAKNPFPIIVPCHRAIRAGGEIGGYQGGPEMKRALLAREGIAFDAAGRAVVRRFYYS
jgi:methylated-DNA-[protein]-cysteine S-methyltransferase